MLHAYFSTNKRFAMFGVDVRRMSFGVLGTVQTEMDKLHPFDATRKPNLFVQNRSVQSGFSVRFRSFETAENRGTRIWRTENRFGYEECHCRLPRNRS